MDTNITHTSTAALAERRFLELLDRNGLPEPDRIDHDGPELVFIWTGRKLMVRVDLSSMPDDDPHSAIS